MKALHTAAPRWRALLAAVLLALPFFPSAFGCGGGSSSNSSTPAPSPTPTPNSVTVFVSGGPVPGEIIPNALYTDVTVCVPGTSQCQTVGGIRVDTGSSGLRILASALTVPLPATNGPSGSPLAECVQFVTSSTWGAVRTADVEMAGETAHSVPIQVIGDTTTGNSPSGCTTGGFAAAATLQDLEANGLLGVGNYSQDCGPDCSVTGSSNPGRYYECSTPSQCQVTTASLAQQVSNPVASFASDNNGVTIALPSVTGEAPSLSGTMTFGIGTQADNAVGQARAITFDSHGFFGTQFNGTSLPISFLDTGSEFFYFADKKVPLCTDFKDLYCPAQVVNLTASIVGANGVSQSVPFEVDNADSLFKLRDSAFASVCGSNIVGQGVVGPSSFDWGLTFYYGRTVFTAIDGRQTPLGVGPFVAF